MAFDRVDARGDLRHHRGRVTGTGADFEHALAVRYARNFDHARDDVRLRNRLSGRDGQRPVLVGVVLQGRIDEALARHVAHRVQQVGIVDAPRGDLPPDHGFALGAEIGHAHPVHERRTSLQP